MTDSTIKRDQSSYKFVSALRLSKIGLRDKRRLDKAIDKSQRQEPMTAMAGLTLRQVDSAIEDLRTGIGSWQLSHFLAWQDIKQRYRRSTLGPIWMTLTFGIQIFTMGFLSSFLFGAALSKSFPYVCAGMLFWALITQTISEGAGLFISTARFLTQIKSPLTVFLLQTVWRNILTSAHNAAIYVVVAIIFFVVPGLSIILWPLGLILDLICLSWMALVCAIVSARYRDVPVIITNIIAVLFWLTPLMYFPEQLGRRRFIADYNPFAHMIALVRDPLLGGTPSLNDWLVVLAMAVFGWIGTFLFFARFRARIVYWL
jgi:ABC-type polysaccharide/polyol phosphate export permease